MKTYSQGPVSGGNEQIAVGQSLGATHREPVPSGINPSSQKQPGTHSPIEHTGWSLGGKW